MCVLQLFFATALLGNPPLDVTKLDCGFRKLALDKAKALQPFRDEATFTAVADGLELYKLCNFSAPVKSSHTPLPPLPSQTPCEARYFVDAVLGSDADGVVGSEGAPYKTMARALDATRLLGLCKNKIPYTKTIVLAAGVHFLNETMVLGSKDSHTSFIAKGDGMPWLSGGAALMAANTPWKKVGSSKIYATKIPESWTDVAGLFSLDPVKVKGDQHARYTRARYPNSDPEIDTWGYASPGRVDVSINASAVMEWHKPAVGEVPTFVTVDLSKPNPSGYIKNDSTMDEYNTWTSGHGGVCDTVWNKGSPSYWCSNGSAGGWANVDAACASSGQLQLPVGMTINTSYPALSRFAKWKNPKGAIVHTWHSQSWATHMFRVDGQTVDSVGANANVSKDTAAVLGEEALAASKSTSLTFSSGGQQGGRNWCRCDQCGYAGKWCGQHQTPPVKDTRLISGDWFVEGVLEELDIPGEYHYDAAERMLYFWPNSTSASTDTAVDHPVGDLIVPQIKTLVRIDGGSDGTATGVSFTGIGFRDSVATYMEPEWSAPSGGDWSLYHGGAFEVTNAADITVKGCTFRRLDGNAVYLVGKSRAVTIEQNLFEWLGENAVATKGNSDTWDARNGQQPRGTVMKQNIIHDLGIYEKQSSGWGHNKAALATVEENIMYNLPRAAINFNDALGGGNLVSNNLLWNTCRESGDHGAINSWDRMPFLHDLHPSGTPSFSPLPTTIANNFIFANYGSSQGVDNDDGSSHFDTHDNVFYMADGFKMDYGGHDSAFHSNLVINYPYDGQNCLNIGGFLKGHGDGFYNNTCLVGVGGLRKPSGCGDPTCFVTPATNLDNVGGISQCDPEYVKVGNNKYYSPNGNASMNCGGTALSIPEVQKQHGIELGSTFDVLPTDAQIIKWAQDRLAM